MTSQRVKTLLSRHGDDFFSRIGKLGFQALVDRHFNGDREAAKRWLVARGQWSIDHELSYAKPGLYKDPGPHPAHIDPMAVWINHAEENISAF